MAFSNTVAANLLNQLFRDDPIYIALYTSNPTAADTGSEVSGGSYARQAITFSAPATESGAQTIKNTSEIQFPVATADWGTVTHVGIRTAATGGNLLSFGTLANARTILSGDRFTILIDNAVQRLS